MRMRLLIVAALSATLLACAHAPTDDTMADDGSDAAKTEADAPKMRCVREKGTGFRLKNRRICTAVDG